MKIEVTIAQTRKPKIASQDLVFGKYFTDHMFSMDYQDGLGWHKPRIEPYAPIAIDPAAMVFHYGQSVFEGLKAYKTTTGKLMLFRPELNLKRMNASNKRLCIPPIDEAFVLQAIRELVHLERDWVPTDAGASLYIRPFIFATEACFGVRASTQFRFMLILSPVGAYYAQGFKPIKIWVEEKAVRAMKGGLGEAKAAANYAASLAAQTAAQRKGCAQVLWLDGAKHKYVEEVGAMNIFFKIGNRILTPELGGSILAGVTRASVIQLLRDWGYALEERKILIDEISEASESGMLEEVFGTGTAAVISPVGALHFRDSKFEVAQGCVGALSLRLYQHLSGMQQGKVADSHGWMLSV